MQKQQCIAPKSKLTPTVQCTNNAKLNTPYCGIHRNCKTRYHNTSINTISTLHLDDDLDNTPLITPNEPNISHNISPNITTHNQTNKHSNHQRHARQRTISGGRPPRKRTKTRTPDSYEQITHVYVNNDNTNDNTDNNTDGNDNNNDNTDGNDNNDDNTDGNDDNGILNHNIQPKDIASKYDVNFNVNMNMVMPINVYAVLPPQLKPGDILTPEFAIKPGVTNRYLDSLLSSDPSLAPRSISALGLDIYRYLLHPFGIFTPTDRIKRFIQRMRSIYLNSNACEAIRKIQCTWRRSRCRSIAYRRGPAWFNPMSLCSNTSDFYTCQDLDEIPPRLLFTYQVPQSQSHNAKLPIYGFHLHSFLELVNSAITAKDRINKTNPKVINPFDRTTIPEEVIIRAQQYDMIIRHWCTVDSQPYHNEIAMAKQENIDNMTPNKRAEMHIIEIFQKIDLLGYHTDINWLSGKNVEQLTKFISALNINWTFRLGLTESVRRQILPPPYHNMVHDLTSIHVMEEITLALGSFGPMMFTSNSQSQSSSMSNNANRSVNMNTREQQLGQILLIREEIKHKLLTRILNCLDAMLSYSATDDARNTACIVILYSLAYINPNDVIDSNPWMD